MLEQLKSPKAAIFLGVAVLGLAADQLTKLWVRTALADRPGPLRLIPGWLDLVHAENPGAANGFLRDFEWRYVLFGLFTVIGVGVIVDLWRKLPRSDRFVSLTLGLVLSGALGNAVDRVHKRTVTDFVRVYTELPAVTDWLADKGLPNAWPTFNVADAALLVGVGLFLAHYLFAGEPEAAPDGEPG